jgi:hypothetical protein
MRAAERHFGRAFKCHNRIAAGSRHLQSFENNRKRTGRCTSTGEFAKMDLSRPLSPVSSGIYLLVRETAAEFA